MNDRIKTERLRGESEQMQARQKGRGLAAEGVTPEILEICSR